MKVQIHTDGSYDVLGTHFQLTGCYPAMNGRALHCVRTDVGSNAITYHLGQGTVMLRFESDAAERLCVLCKAEGLSGIHSLSPLAGAKAEKAEQVFVQGFGMEGPSGVYAIGDAAPASHGLTALSAGEHTLLAYAEDHTRFHLCLESDPDFSAAFVLEGAAGADVKKYADAGLTIASYDYDPDDHYSKLGAEMQRYLADQCSREELAKSIETYWATVTPVEH